jgi:ABC-2 type transport system ATP-binding protein
MSFISVTDLTKTYKDVPVLQGVTFAIAQGSIYALLGSNGAGKTTTINILSTLLTPDGGTAMIAGYNVATEAKKVREHISLTGQYAAIDDLLTARENMLMMGSLNRIPAKIAKARTAQLLQQFDLEKVANKRVSTYSGGMRRKLDLAISLLAAPPIIFLDEPTTGLDPRSRQELWRVIRELARSGTTILLTTQYLDEADSLADSIGVLNQGRIVAEGTASELKRRVGTEYIELVFKNAADCVKAQKLIAGASVADNSDSSLLVPLTDRVDDVRSVLDTLATASLKPTTFSLRQPTLDDVFMQLTESPTQESGA